MNTLRAAALLVLFGTLVSGCAQFHVTRAQQVGGPEGTTWVFIGTDDDDETGVYRCRDIGDRPVCTKARLDRE